MEMKLNAQYIRQLRLEKSWSQEKLAEIAGLTTRTIQRVEAEGSASLQTRLNLARAFGVEPLILDALVASQVAFADNPTSADAGAGKAGEIWQHLKSKSIHEFTLLLLVSCIFLAATPVYFSFSRVNFSWINFGMAWPVPFVWWLMTFSIWLLLAIPWLWKSYRGNRSFCLLPVIMAFVPLSLGILQFWQQVLTMTLLTYTLYGSTMVLLLSLYLPGNYSSKPRNAVLFTLFSYIFLWYFQAIGHYLVPAIAAKSALGIDIQWSFIGKATIRTIGNLVQLTPVLLVLLMSLKTGDSRDRNNSVQKFSVFRSSRKKATDEIAPDSGSRKFELQNTSGY